MPRSTRPSPPPARRSRRGQISGRANDTPTSLASPTRSTRPSPTWPRSRRADNGSLYEAMSLRVLPRAANNIRFFADFAKDRLTENTTRTLPGGERNRVRYDPAGVAAVSTPWNAPFMLATWRVGPALAAGDTVVLKPPEWAPLTCSLLGDLADEARPPTRGPQHRPRDGRRRRRSAHRTQRCRPGRVHGLAGDRAHRLPRRRREPHPGVVRARRQVAVHRVRRRRPRRGGGDRGLPVRQLGPGLPRGHAPPRPTLDPRRLPRTPR